ncbi:MAG: hypothetical protein ABIQ95_06765 [Bdellovibrionia bacterium]
MLIRIFKKSLLFKFLFLLLIQNHNAGATLILGHQNHSDKFIPIQFIDPSFSWARSVVDASEWPASSVNSKPIIEKQIDYEEQFEKQPGTEEAYVNKRLKEKWTSFKDPNLPDIPVPTVIWVPTTLWDLFVIRNYALSKTFWAENTPIRTTFHFSLFDNKKNILEARIFHDFVSYIQKLKKGKLAILVHKPKALRQIVLSILADIENADNQDALGNETKDQVEVFKSIFRQEAYAIRTGRPSFLLTTIKIELEAYQTNSVLLWRSTNGLVYCLDPEETAPILQSRLSKIKSLKSFLTRFWPDRFKTGVSQVKKEILDFPMWCDGPAKENALLRNPQLAHLGFSFSFSPLAGFLLDGIFSKCSACTFVYSIRDKYKYTYFLMLDKKWLTTEGKKFFFIPNVSSTDGIFSRGENFHPRTYNLAPYENNFSIAMSAADSQPFVENNEVIQELSTIFATRYPNKTDEELHEFAKFLSTGVNFNSQISSIIAREARIIRIGNRNIEDSGSDRECQSLLYFQEQAAHLLERKFKWLFIHRQLKNKKFALSPNT